CLFLFSQFLCIFRPVPLYGHRPMLDVQRFPSLFSPFPPYLGYPGIKPDSRTSIDLYGNTGRLAAYNLYIQESLKRLHENRLQTTTNDVIRPTVPEPPNMTSLSTDKETSLAHSLSMLRQRDPNQDRNAAMLNSSSFSDNLGVQYNMGRKVFPCPQCRYTTDRRNNLKRHMLTMHQTCPKLLECCGILFSTKALLREHAMIFHYHGYTCFYCGRRFCRKALLKRHLSVHNGQKDFVCNVCDYATSHKSNLERHRKVHMRQDELPEEESSSHNTSEQDNGTREEPRALDDETESENISVCSDSDEEVINVHSD
ncbi:hypothetical protein FSP39_006460, partial [Pinctada imbricata]